MLKTVEKIHNTLNSIEYLILIPMFTFMLGLMIIQVIFRYFLELPLGWSEELVRYVFVASIFLGAAVATKEREHIEINFIETIVNKYHERPDIQGKIIMVSNVLRDTMTTIFILYIAKETWGLIADQYTYNLLSPAMRVPLYLVTAWIFAGCIIIALQSIMLIILNTHGMGKTGYEKDGGEDTCIS